MKTSVLMVESALMLGLCLGPGCATRRGAEVQVQDPGYTPPVGQPASTNPPTIVRESPPPEPPPVKPPPAKPAATQPPSAAPVVVTEPPPPPHVEVVRSSPGPQYVWIPGYWEWKNRWSWVNGHWALGPHDNAVWVPGRWIRRASGGWVWVRGYWR